MRPRKFLLSLLAALTLAAPLALVGGAPAQAYTSPAAKFVEHINAARARNGLDPLKVRSDLSTYARSHSAAMAGRRTLFHTPSFSVVCCWASISENVAYDGTVLAAHRALMRSPGHRANILDPGKRAVGVGVVRAGGRLWVTQLFRAPRG